MKVKLVTGFVTAAFLFGVSTFGLNVAAQTHANPSQTQSGNCLTDNKAQTLAEEASKHLINRTFDEYGGGKRIRVTLLRCVTVMNMSNEVPQDLVYDLSYALTWRKGHRFGKKYSLDLDAELSADGSLGTLSVINASYKLDNKFVESFPLQIKYFSRPKG